MNAKGRSKATRSAIEAPKPKAHGSRAPGSSRGGRRPTRPRRKRSAPPSRRNLALASLMGATLCLALFASGLWLWGQSLPVVATPAPSFSRIEVAVHDDNEATLKRLTAEGLLTRPRLALWYQRVWLPLLEIEPGVHWLPRGLSPRQTLSILGRRHGRTVKRVVLPEGWDSFQIAQRLAEAGICEQQAFLQAVQAGSQSVPGSLEGYLYPATYELRVNTAAGFVVQRLEREARRRFDLVFEQHSSPLANLSADLGLNRSALVSLASIVEKEAADRDEYGLIASVFLNRLRDPTFRPVKMLQSDPTAAYGCKVNPSIESCQRFSGRVTSTMLRDSRNPYNTYRHSGLPPTAIGNPSTEALAAVLTAPPTPYYFFVSPSGGRHHFSRTLDEHEGHFRSR